LFAERTTTLRQLFLGPFRAGDLDFSSTGYRWLVVAGAHAKFKGTGTIDESGDYGFMITASLTSMFVKIESSVAVRGSQRGKTWTPAAIATPPNARFEETTVTPADC
jgi:hypothetical protein